MTWWCEEGSQFPTSVGNSIVSSLPVGIPFRQDVTVFEGSRGQVLVVSCPWVEGRLRLSGFSGSRLRSGFRSLVLRVAENPRRASALAGLRSGGGTDPRRDQSPEAAGHRDLLVLRAEDCDVTNGMRVRALRHSALWGGKALEGEPQEWYRLSKSEGVGGSKPSRG